MNNLKLQVLKTALGAKQISKVEFDHIMLREKIKALQVMLAEKHTELALKGEFNLELDMVIQYIDQELLPEGE